MNRKRILLSIAAGTIGLLVSQFPVPIFTGATFRLGGALYLATGILLGPLYGLLAGLIVALGPLAAQTQIWPIVFIAVEALVVPWAHRRHSIPPVAASFVFRSCCVLPWGIAVYRLGLAASNSEPWVAVLWFVLSGVMVTLIAELLVSTSATISLRAG